MSGLLSDVVESSKMLCILMQTQSTGHVKCGRNAAFCCFGSMRAKRQSRALLSRTVEMVATRSAGLPEPFECQAEVPYIDSLVQ